MNQRWRVLVLGCGWITRQVHLPYLAHLRRAGRIASIHVADADADRAAQAAAAYGACIHPPEPPTPGRFDVVLVATPPASHATLTLAALAAAAHVIVEKPLALTPTDAAAILDTCARHGRGVYPLYTARHRPEFPLIRSALEPEVGQVQAVFGSWPRRAGVPATAGGLQAGVLWDTGSHLIDTALYLTGWPAAAGIATGHHTHPAAHRSTEGARARWQTGPSTDAAAADAPAWYGVEADVTLTIPTTGAELGLLSIETSWSAPVTADLTRVVVVGERGRLIWRTVFGWSPDRDRVAEPTVWISDLTGRRRRVLREGQPRDPRAEYTAQWEAALAALTDNDPAAGRCQAELRAALSTTTVLHAIQTSLDTGRRSRWPPPSRSRRREPC